MELNEYQELAMKTCGQATENARLIMAAMGIAGESGEIVDHIKKFLFHAHDIGLQELEKEIGDASWYVALMCTAINVKLGDTLTQLATQIERVEFYGPKEQEERLALATLNLAITSGHISEHVDMILYSTGSMKVSVDRMQRLIQRQLRNFARYLILLCYCLELSFDDILEANIAKLKKRYPHGFTNEASIHREEYKATFIE